MTTINLVGTQTETPLYAEKPTPYDMLREFHRVFDAGENEEMTDKLLYLRSDLIEEEFEEVQAELYPDDLKPNKKKLTKELADLMYVVIGTAVAFGLPLEEVFEAVHKNNMTKVHPDGTIRRREDGKILKPDTFKELDLTPFFKENA